jgi:multiple antibiotic resistance protein
MDIFLQTFITLFVVVDPLGSSAVFSALVRNRTAEESRRIAFKAVFLGILILLMFGFLGNALLGHLGVSIPAFRIAGGLLLFVTAFRMLMGFHDPDHISSDKSAYADKTDIAIFPLAIPLLAGPGCMTAVMLHVTETANMTDKGWVALAIVAVEICALFSMLFANRLVRVFGASGSSLLARIMGILMAALSVQFIVDGVKAIF